MATKFSHWTFAVILALICLSAPAAARGAAAAGWDAAAAEVQLIDLVNADRAANGVSSVVADPRLMEVARWRSEDMVARNFFSHEAGLFSMSQLLLSRQVAFDLAGENLAVNTFDEARTVLMAQASFMASPGHRANILRPDFTLVGVGIAVGPGDRTVFTQIFVAG